MRKNERENGFHPNGQDQSLFPENIESYVLSLTRISFLDDFVIFKTPHNTLGFYCGGTVTTFAKLEDGEKPSVVFDQFNTTCSSDCGVRTVFPLKGEATIRAVNTARELGEIILPKPNTSQRVVDRNTLK